MEIGNIHESLINGQRKLFVKQVDDYGLYDFWADYKEYLKDTYTRPETAIARYFTDATISYFRIKTR